MSFEKFERVNAGHVEFGHAHAGITGSASVSECFPDFKMQMVGRSEIGALQLFCVKQAR